MDPVIPKRLDQLTGMELPPFAPGVAEWVRWSIAKLPRHNPRILTEVFYEELFAMAPATRALFPADMDPQEDRLLFALLTVAQYMTDHLGLVREQLEIWGVKHRREYGITDEMYVYVGHALVRTINRLLSNDDSRVHSAWVAVYQWMAAVMIAAADDADQEGAGYEMHNRFQRSLRRANGGGVHIEYHD